MLKVPLRRTIRPWRPQYPATPWRYAPKGLDYMLTRVRDGWLVIVSDNIKNVCEQILKGRKTDWVLRTVLIGLHDTKLEFEHPASKEDGDEYIIVYADKDVELQFEIECDKRTFD